MNPSKETIIAMATPPGRSGVALVRMSGPQAFSIFQKLSKISKKKIISHKVQFVKIYNEQNKKIDEALAWAMRGPKTYTGEDVVEISTHGNPIVVHQIITAGIKYGARVATRGEFTKRAFLAGRIDLPQAEAIAQLVSANSSAVTEAALLHLEGALSKEIKIIREKIIALLARIEAGLDYPDELGELPRREIKKEALAAKKKVQGLLATSQQGKILKEGLKVVIAGAPNVGKSSLLNCLVGDSKSIVTEIPGTTRDAIEDIITLEGVPLRIIDTAGLRDSSGQIEKIGIERTLAHVETADVVLFVLDLSRKPHPEEMQKIEELKKKGLAVLAVGNKVDLIKKSRKKNEVDAALSARTGEGIKLLEKKLLRLAGAREQKESSSPIIMEARHREKLLEAESALDRVLRAVERKMEQDLITIDLKGAALALGEITGEAVSEEVINHIFNNFCVGK